MSTRQIRALAVSVVLVFTLAGMPAMAATRDGGAKDRDVPALEKVIKRVQGIIRSFSDGLTLPRP